MSPTMVPLIAIIALQSVGAVQGTALWGEVCTQSEVQKMLFCDASQPLEARVRSVRFVVKEPALAREVHRDRKGRGRRTESAPR